MFLGMGSLCWGGVIKLWHWIGNWNILTHLRFFWTPVRIIFIFFIFFYRTTWPNTTNHGTKQSRVKRLQYCSNEWSRMEIAKIHSWIYSNQSYIYKNLFLKNHMAKCNQTWRKFVQKRTSHYSWLDVILSNEFCL